MKVAILGFGTVGNSVARILCEHPPQGVELGCIFNRGIDRKRVSWVPSSVLWTENFDEVLASKPDIVVELAGGLQPAGEWVRQALAAGKSVVTANKKLIAEQGLALEELARRHGCQLLYGAAVAGGVPVIPAVQQGLAGDRINRFHGILNGTCNFILSNMEDGAEFEPTLRRRRSADTPRPIPPKMSMASMPGPSWLSSPASGCAWRCCRRKLPAAPSAMSPAIDFAYAKDLRCTIRQISRAEVRDQELLATVGPMLVPRSSPLSWSRGTENMVISGGQYGGETVFSGHGAGGNPTAVAVISDVLAIAHGGCPVTITSTRARVDGDFVVPHYIRFVVDDRPGIVAAIAGHLAEQHININALLQKPGYPKEPALCGHGRTLPQLRVEEGPDQDRPAGLYAGAAFRFADA